MSRTTGLTQGRAAVRALIAKKVVGEVMIIERLARYDARPRPPSDPCQLNVPGCVYLKERFPVFFP